MGKVSIKETLAMNSRKIAESNAKTNLPDTAKIENNNMEPQKLAEKEKLELELAQAKHREQRLLAQNKVKERKARTRRLIQEGAILEKALPQTMQMTLEQLETFLCEVFKAVR